MSMPGPNSDETLRLLDRVRSGASHASDELFARYQNYLRRVVQLRLDPGIRRRVDVSDVVQEAQLEALRRLEDYLRSPALPFRLWLRQIAHDRLLMLQRRHLGAARRAVTREVPLPEATALQLGGGILNTNSTPSVQLARGELARRVGRAMLLLSADDRELLLMRSLEGLSNQDAAQVLGIEPAAASKRYGRALLRLRAVLLAGGVSESQI